MSRDVMKNTVEGLAEQQVPVSIIAALIAVAVIILRKFCSPSNSLGAYRSCTSHYLAGDSLIEAAKDTATLRALPLQTESQKKLCNDGAGHKTPNPIYYSRSKPENGRSSCLSADTITKTIATTALHTARRKNISHDASGLSSGSGQRPRRLQLAGSTKPPPNLGMEGDLLFEDTDVYD